MYTHKAILIAGLYVANSLAALCTVSNATPFAVLVASITSSGGGGGGGSNSEWEEYLTSSNNAALDGAGDLLKDSVRRRAVLTCWGTGVGSEYCVVLEPAGPDTLVCINANTADYHSVGESGNLITGDYKFANGTTGNVNAVPTVLVTAAGTIRQTSSIAEQTKSVGSTSVTVRTTSSSSGTATVVGVTATPTPTSGAFKMEVGFGLLVGVVGMILL